MTRSEMLAELADCSEADLLAGLRAARASRRAREERFYFLHYFLEERLTGEENRPVIEIPVTDAVMNPVGMTHGGVLATLSDDAMGVASFFSAGRPGVTLNLNVQYHRPARGPRLRAEAEVVSRGSKINATRCEIRDAGGVLVASATGVFYHRNPS